MKPIRRELALRPGTMDLGRLAQHNRARIFERILLVAQSAVYESMKDAFAENLFTLDWVDSGAEAVRRLCRTDFEVVMADVTPTFPADAFYIAIQRMKPYLSRRLLFFVGQNTDPKLVEFLRKQRAAMLWRPYEVYVLFESIDDIVRKTSQLVSLSESTGLSLRVA